jgi:hypothetical protein
MLHGLEVRCLLSTCLWLCDSDMHGKCGQGKRGHGGLLIFVEIHGFARDLECSLLRMRTCISRHNITLYLASSVSQGYVTCHLYYGDSLKVVF